MIVGYLDTSPKNLKTEEQQSVIEDFVVAGKQKVDLFLSNSSITNLKDIANLSGHTLVVANVMALGDKSNGIIANIEALIADNISLHLATEKLCFDSLSTNSDVILGMRLMDELNRRAVSFRAVRACRQKEAFGQKIGRKPGSKNKQSIAHRYGRLIIESASRGMSKSAIARQFGISHRSVYNVLQTIGEKDFATN